MRSGWKVPYLDNVLFRRKYAKTNNWTTRVRASVILPFLVGKVFNVYNGWRYQGVRVRKQMLYHRVGEFCLNKQMSRRIHSRSEKGKRKKN